MSYRRKSKNRFVGVITIALAVVLLVGALGFMSSGFKDWKIKDWFKKKANDNDPTALAIAEYDRIANLNSDDTAASATAGTSSIYDFNTLDKIQIKQTVNMTLPSLNTNISQTNESMDFRLDRTDLTAVKSSSARARLREITTDGYPGIDEFNTWVYNGVYSSSVETSNSDYGSYDGFINAYSTNPNAATLVPDIFFRNNITLFDRTKYSSITGTKNSSSAGTETASATGTASGYTIISEVNTEYLTDFYYYFETLFPWLSHRSNAGDFKYYHLNGLTSANIEILTSANNLDLVTITMDFAEILVWGYGTYPAATLTATMEINQAGFAVSTTT